MALNRHMKRLALASLIYGGGSIIQRLITILLLPFFTQVLSPKDYGIIALVSLVGIVMSGVLSLGTGNSMGVMYFSERVTKKRPSIIWTNFVLIFLNCMIWYWILYLLAPILSYFMFKSDEYAYLIRISFLSSVFIAISDPFLAYLRMEEKAKNFVFLTFTGSLVTVSISVFFVLWKSMGVEGLILATTMGSGISFLLIIFSVGTKLKFCLNFDLVIPLVRIGVPSVFGLFAFLIIDYADRQMIERFLGIYDLGIYSIGYSFGMFMTLPVGAFCSAWPPFFMSYINKRARAKILFGQVFNYYLVIFCSLTILFFAASLPLVKIFTSDFYHDAWVVVGLIAAAYGLKGCYVIIQAGICFEKKFGLISTIDWLAAIINIALNLLLIPVFGILGAALATFTSYLSLPIVGWLIARSYLKVNYKALNITVMAFLTTFISFILFFISKGINDTGLHFSYYLLLFIIPLGFFYFSFKFMLDKESKNIVLEGLKS